MSHDSIGFYVLYIRMRAEPLYELRGGIGSCSADRIQMHVVVQRAYIREGRARLFRLLT